MGWLGTWAKRVKLTIDQNDIDSILSNFPILLYLSISSGRNADDISFIFDELQSDDNRKKIAVTTSDGTTQCYVEIEKWDDANEKAWLWVKVPSIASDVDSDLYLYYDSEQPENTTYVDDTNVGNSYNVWDPNFKLVYHMADKSGDNTAVVDSTSNNNDGTKTGANAPAETTSGKIGNAQYFDYIDDKILYANAVDGDYFTIETWAFLDQLPSSVGTNFVMLTDEDSVGSHRRFLLHFFGSNDKPFAFWFNTSGVCNEVYDFSAASVSAQTWQHWALVTDNTVNSILYMNGSEYETDSASGTFRSTANSEAAGRVIGANYLEGTGYRSFFDGMLDEIRFSNITRSAAWIKATYETGRDHLLDWGSEEALTKIKTYTADVLLKKIGTKTLTSDLFLQKLGLPKAFDADALIQKKDITKTFDIDTILTTMAVEKQYDADVLLQKKDLTKAYDTDTYLLKKDLTKTPTFDALLLKKDIGKPLSIDALIKKSIEKTATFDALLKKKDLEKALAIDSILMKRGITSLTVDVELLKSVIKAFTIDALVKVLGLTKTYTTDALIKKLDAVSAYTTDAILKAIKEKGYTIDAIIVKRLTKELTTDLIIKKIGTKPLTVDALLKRLGVTKSYAIDVYLAEEGIKTYLIDMLIKKVQEKAYLADILMKKGILASYPADILIRKVAPIAYSADMRLVRSNLLFGRPTIGSKVMAKMSIIKNVPRV